MTLGGLLLGLLAGIGVVLAAWAARSPRHPSAPEVRRGAVAGLTLLGLLLVVTLPAGGLLVMLAWSYADAPGAGTRPVPVTAAVVALVAAETAALVAVWRRR